MTAMLLSAAAELLDKRRTRNGMNYVLPLIALRNLVVMPNSSVSFDVLRDFSKKAVDAALADTRQVIIVTQTDPRVEKPTSSDLYLTGTLANVRQVMKAPNGAVRIVVDGVCRVSIDEILLKDPYYTVSAVEIDVRESLNTVENMAYIESLQQIFSEYIRLSRVIKQEELLKRIADIQTLGALCDCLIGIATLDFNTKQELLETVDVSERVEAFMTVLSCEIEVLQLRNKLNMKVRERMEQNQRDYYLREERKIIDEELGEDIEDEAESYRERISSFNLTDEVREKLLKEVSRFERMASSNADSAVLRNYLDTVCELPWDNKSEERLDIQRVKEQLDADHYGMEKVKERIIEQLAVRVLTDGRQGTLICLAGPPGTGKTSIARSIAEAINRKYVRISLGGVRDEAEIRGHRKTYIGAMPGRIISGIIQAKTKNPLILLDEIDKLGNDVKGDPSSALLEVLDYEQNKDFKDHYLDVPFDLSDVMFITTANDVSQIPAPLYDRLEVIEISGYTNVEKLEIARNYLVKKQAKACGIENKKFTITDDALKMICEHYTREAGVRRTERTIASLMRKLARQFIEENRRSITVNKKNLEKYLGKPKYHYQMMNDTDQVGIVRGLAWTAVGGDTLSVEVNVMDGTGKTELTGQLGDVMQESAKAAISYIRSVSKPLGIESDFYKTKDIHIHIPEGAVPKDGPSAGVTLATAVASALTGKPVRRDVAMTGEITLRGRVLPIGGLKEKAIAAYRAGIGTVIIPEENRVDLDEIPDEVRDGIKFIPVKDMNSVLSHSLLK